MLHTWLQATYRPWAAVRVVLFDCRKAFDLSDHTLLVRKGFGLPIPRAVAFCVADFLTHRQQRVKLSGDCFSAWGPVPDGVSQGTKLGPSLFLRVSSADINRRKGNFLPGGAINHLPKNFSQVARIFTKRTVEKKRGPYDATT